MEPRNERKARIVENRIFTWMRSRLLLLRHHLIDMTSSTAEKKDLKPRKIEGRVKGDGCIETAHKCGLSSAAMMIIGLSITTGAVITHDWVNFLIR